MTEPTSPLQTMGVISKEVKNRHPTEKAISNNEEAKTQDEFQMRNTKHFFIPNGPYTNN